MIKKVLSFFMFFLLLVFGVSAQKGEPITLYGVNFDMDSTTIKKTLSERFDCSLVPKPEKHSEYLCTHDTSADVVAVIQIEKALPELDDQITLIKIGCKVWNGCGINPEEIFLKIIKEKYQKYSGGKLPQLTIPQTVESRELCMIGFMGEKICVTESNREIRMYRHKFNNKP